MNHPQQGHHQARTQQPPQNNNYVTPPTFTFNSEEARQGEGGSSYINESGGYVGVFTKAKFFFTENNAQGIEFSFETPNGESLNNITVYTVGKDGSDLVGKKKIQALMCCMSLRGVKPTNGRFREYDYSSGQEVEKEGVIYPEFLHTPVGLVIQFEEYLNSAQELKRKPMLYACYNAQSRQMASEILDQVQPTKLTKILENLKDRPLKNQGNSQPRANNAPPAGQPNQASSAMDFDDDIPF